MKKLIIIIPFFVFLFNLAGCSLGGYSISPYGDKADIQFKDGGELKCELILISDSSVVFGLSQKYSDVTSELFYSPKNEIRSIKVNGYSDEGWVVPVLVFQGVPAVLLAVAAGSAGNPNGALIGLATAIPAIVTALIFALSAGNTPEWNYDSPKDDINDLKIYCRYPAGLSNEELKRLLKGYNQENIKKYFFNYEIIN